MKKNEIKAVCETDEKLQWWAMVLFAEISELVNYQQQTDSMGEVKHYYSVIITKVKEFERLLIQRQVEKAEDKPTLEQRVEVLERKMSNNEHTPDAPG